VEQHHAQHAKEGPDGYGGAATRHTPHYVGVPDMPSGVFKHDAKQVPYGGLVQHRRDTELQVATRLGKALSSNRGVEEAAEEGDLDLNTDEDEEYEEDKEEEAAEEGDLDLNADKDEEYEEDKEAEVGRAFLMEPHKVGKSPAWLDPDDLPADEARLCGFCGEPPRFGSRCTRCCPDAGQGLGRGTPPCLVFLHVHGLGVPLQDQREQRAAVRTRRGALASRLRRSAAGAAPRESTGRAPPAILVIRTRQNWPVKSETGASVGPGHIKDRACM